MLNDHIDVESELLKYYSSRTGTEVYILTTFLQLVVTLTRVKSSFFQSEFLIDIFYLIHCTKIYERMENNSQPLIASNFILATAKYFTGHQTEGNFILNSPSWMIKFRVKFKIYRVVQTT